jgi:hypothetical protein
LIIDDQVNCFEFVFVGTVVGDVDSVVVVVVVVVFVVAVVFVVFVFVVAVVAVVFVVVVVVMVVVVVDSDVGGIFKKIFSNKCFGKNLNSRAKLTAVKYDFIQFFLPGSFLDGQPIVDFKCILKIISSQNTFIFTF